MTDAEIIKAQKLCGCTPDCSWCPYYDPNKEHNRKCYGRKNKDFDDHINRLQADKEALIAGQETLQKALVTAKSEAIKEFAERLKYIYTNYDRIKAMSIEEMAEFLGETISGCPRHTEVCEVNATCTDCFKQYLESEVDTDEK